MSPFPFTRAGFVHALLARDGAIALVERTRTGWGAKHWEVWVIRDQREKVMPSGRLRPAGDRFPSDEDWGRFGWTYSTLAEAERKYRRLCAPPRERGGS